MIPSTPVRRLDLSSGNRVRRAIWSVIWVLLYRFSPTPLHFWRRAVLRSFGARIGNGVHPYPRARIWAPWNLRMDEGSCLANDVDCYNVAPVAIGKKATVSQYSFLCTASHDYRDPFFGLVAAEINVGDNAWIGAD